MKTKNYSKKQRIEGFTLIELLVVISIIGVLSSVVLASLNQAKLKARDARLKSDVHQMAILLHQEYNDTGSYAGLQSYWNEIWVSANPSHVEGQTDSWNYACGEEFPPIGIFTATSKYKDQMVALCNDALKNAPASILTIYFGQASPGFDDPAIWPRYQKFSIGVLLNTGKYFCTGSSGATSESSDGTSWTQPGCYQNP